MKRASIAPLLGVLACGGAEAPPRANPPSPAVASALPPATPEPERDSGVAPRLVAEQPVVLSAPIEARFDRPSEDEALPLDGWASFVPQLHVAGEAPARWAIVLDDFRVRYVERGQGIPGLRELVPADRDLEPGPHRLVAIAVSEDGRLLRGDGAATVRRFSLGPPAGAPPPADEPAIVYVEPQGTYNGQAAATAARLDYHLIGGESHLLRVRIVGPRGRRTEVLDERTSYRFDALESGDYRIELQLLEAEDRSARGRGVARAITVNLDAPRP